MVEARIPYIYTWGVPKVRVLSTLSSCSRGATGRHIGFKHRTSDGFDSLREYQKKYCGIVQFGRTLDVNQGVGGSIPSPTARRIKNGTGARVRLIGAVLKTVGAGASVGSNPTLSAKFIDIYTGYEVEQTSALKN